MQVVPTCRRQTSIGGAVSSTGRISPTSISPAPASRDSSFKRTDLSASLLEDVDARRAKFVSSIMQDVLLDGANLVRADLTKADLKGASLKALI